MNSLVGGLGGGSSPQATKLAQFWQRTNVCEAGARQGLSRRLVSVTHRTHLSERVAVYRDDFTSAVLAGAAMS